MATLEQALTALLKGDAAVATLVGGRVYPKVLPQGVIYPAISYQRISTARAPWRRLDDHKPAMEQPRFQLNCYAATPLAAQAVEDAMVALLDGFRGTSAGVAIASSVVEDRADDIEPEAHVGGEHVFGRRVDVFLSFVTG